MTEKELDMIEFQSHGQDLRAIKFLRAEIERLNENIKTLLANHQNVRAKLEAAERDAERLDFIESQTDGGGWIARKSGTRLLS